MTETTVDLAASQASRERREELPAGGALVVRGEPGAAPILFLHGAGGAAWSWEPQAAAFANGRRTYAWEARGHGGCPRVADAGLADYYLDAQQALERVVALEGRPPIVAGHSTGGFLALALGASRPDAVAGLFLVEPVYFGAGLALKSGLFGPFGVFARPFLVQLAQGFQDDDAWALIFARYLFSLTFYDRTVMERAWQFQRRQTPIEYPRAIIELADGPAGFPLRLFAEEIDAPTRLVEGSVGWFQPHFPNLVTQLRSKLGSAFDYRMFAGGHYLQLDCESTLNAQLRQFLEPFA
ncbi:MAG: alpha/beta fold hydrolase [Vulcanimicrobiaceae bacterium]